MAKVIPDWTTLRPASAGEHAEVGVLKRLCEGLPDAYTVVHSVDWSIGSGLSERHGEIDVVVVAPSGDLVLMEVKSGFVRTDGATFEKQYGHRTSDVLAQARMQYGVIRSRLERAGLSARLHHLLVLTDLQVRSEIVQWPREQIVDANELDSVAARVRDALGIGRQDADLQRQVVAFVCGVLKVVQDVSAMVGQTQDASRRLSDGLATWVPRMTVPSGLVRVQATAGSGKTQLALRMLRDADAGGLRTRYVCFNRALADHMARILPVRVVAETFHEMALGIARRDGKAPDFSEPGAFDRLAAHALSALRGAAADLDVVVIDEVQDLQPEWVEALLGRLRANGRALLLEDPDQSLYPDSESFDLPDAVIVRSHENFRSPRALVGLVNLLRLTDTPVEARGPVEGELPEPLVYDDERKVVRQTEAAVRRCLDRGFQPGEIAVITLRGRERSAVLGAERLAGLQLRKFTGRYDEGGQPLWSAGDLLVDTVRRFKGQAAPALVITECDITDFNELARRLLFVGLTRAQLHLEWVLSGATEEAIARRVA